LLFEALDLPIRPSFWDFQFKVAHKLDDKTTLTALGVGAIDDFTFGGSAQCHTRKSVYPKFYPYD
jgi:hypothetical protein